MRLVLVVLGVLCAAWAVVGCDGEPSGPEPGIEPEFSLTPQSHALITQQASMVQGFQGAIDLPDPPDEVGWCATLIRRNGNFVERKKRLTAQAAKKDEGTGTKVYRYWRTGGSDPSQVSRVAVCLIPNTTEAITAVWEQFRKHDSNPSPHQFAALPSTKSKLGTVLGEIGTFLLPEARAQESGCWWVPGEEEPEYCWTEVDGIEIVTCTNALQSYDPDTDSCVCDNHSDYSDCHIDNPDDPPVIPDPPGGCDPQFDEDCGEGGGDGDGDGDGDGEPEPSVVCTTVVRGQPTTCTVDPDGLAIIEWSFGGEGGESVERTTGNTSPTWTGPAVVSGSVVVELYGGIMAEGELNVTPRDWRWSSSVWKYEDLTARADLDRGSVEEGDSIRLGWRCSIPACVTGFIRPDQDKEPGRGYTHGVVPIGGPNGGLYWIVSADGFKSDAGSNIHSHIRATSSITWSTTSTDSLEASCSGMNWYQMNLCMGAPANYLVESVLLHEGKGRNGDGHQSFYEVAASQFAGDPRAAVERIVIDSDNANNIHEAAGSVITGLNAALKIAGGVEATTNHVPTWYYFPTTGSAGPFLRLLLPSF